MNNATFAVTKGRDRVQHPTRLASSRANITPKSACKFSFLQIHNIENTSGLLSPYSFPGQECLIPYRWRPTYQNHVTRYIYVALYSRPGNLKYLSIPNDAKLITDGLRRAYTYLTERRGGKDGGGA